MLQFRNFYEALEVMKPSETGREYFSAENRSQEEFLRAYQRKFGEMSLTQVSKSHAGLEIAYVLHVA